jgi:hypothetical protein
MERGDGVLESVKTMLVVTMSRLLNLNTYIGSIFVEKRYLKIACDQNF